MRCVKLDYEILLFGSETPMSNIRSQIVRPAQAAALTTPLQSCNYRTKAVRLQDTMNTMPARLTLSHVHQRKQEVGPEINSNCQVSNSTILQPQVSSSAF